MGGLHANTTPFHTGDVSITGLVSAGVLEPNPTTLRDNCQGRLTPIPATLDGTGLSSAEPFSG